MSLPGLGPNFVTRREWRARAPTCSTPIEASAIRFLVVHYTAMNADEQALHKNCAARVRGIQRYHMESDQLAPGGACDIGYTWVFCKHGAIFQGRGWKKRPAATGAANSYTLAACFLGNDTAGRDDVTDKGRAALRRIVAFMEARCRNMEGVRGHRDFMATACPGDQLYRYVKTLDQGF
jgi:hypothetical protein